MCLAWRDSHPALSPASVTHLGGETPPHPLPQTGPLEGVRLVLELRLAQGEGESTFQQITVWITCQGKVCQSPRLLALWPLAGPTNPRADKAQLLTSCLSMRPFVQRGSEARSGPTRGLIKLQRRPGTKGPHTRPERPGSAQDPLAVSQLPRPGWPRRAHASRLPHITGRGRRGQDPPAGGRGGPSIRGRQEGAPRGAAGNQSLPKFPIWEPEGPAL